MDFSAHIAAAGTQHSKNVARISGMLAERAGYGPAEVSVISQAAALHDIGKIAIPRSILDKPAALTPEEYTIIKRHTVVGFKQITDSIRILMAAAVICKEHHEWPGDATRGYIGLKGEEIHPYARIVALADVYDALAEIRPYRKEPWSAGGIRGYFEDQAGKQFDSFLVREFLGMTDEISKLYGQNRCEGRPDI
jgi:putative two-component system response regulator